MTHLAKLSQVCTSVVSIKNPKGLKLTFRVLLSLASLLGHSFLVTGRTLEQELLCVEYAIFAEAAGHDRLFLGCYLPAHL